MKKKKIVKVLDIVPVSGKKTHRAKVKKERTEEVNFVEKKDVFPEFDLKNDSFLKETDSFEGEERKGKKSVLKKVLRLILILGIGGGVIYVAFFILPKVEVRVFSKKVPWSFEGSVVVNKNINQIDLASKQIPGEILVKKGNQVFKFTPSGKKMGESKARGVITVVNNFGPVSQKLVATTRFQTADGKIFRLVSDVIIPPAKVVDGKIQPSSIDVQVIADKAGPDYNIGPQSKFTIPGFQGTQKYQGFYGYSTQPMKGGAVGEISFVTEEDAKKAEAEAETKLKEALLSSLLMSFPQDLVYLDNAYDFAVLKKEVDSNLDENGQFSIFVDGQISLIVFKKENLVELLKKIAWEENIPQNYVQTQEKLEYQKPLVDWKAGRAEIPLKYHTVFAAPLDANRLKKEILGKKETELKSYILSLAGIDKLNVSFWPFWVKSVPQKEDRVQIIVE
ncbi:MAG: baseplate J/gp47 family protein [Patescibacteria group bacterium]|nr:baseplate J/gp47 family protein [Patescibacteria group bacterium]